MRNEKKIASSTVKLKARLVGAFFLLYAVIGATGYFVSQSLIVAHDVTATAANVLAGETSLRFAIAANLTAAFCYLVMATLLYDVFRPVDRTMARLAVLFLLLSCAIGAFDSLFQLAALDILKGDGFMAAISTPERHALAFLMLIQHVRALDMGLVFFGMLWLVVGYLCLRSTFVPRLIGIIAVLNGLWYMPHLYRPLAEALLPYVMIAPGVGGIAVMLWFTIKGVDAPHWDEQAGIEPEPAN